MPSLEATEGDQDPMALWHLVSVVCNWEYSIVACDEVSGVAEGHQRLLRPGRKSLSIRDYDELNDSFALQVIEHDTGFRRMRLSELV